MEYFKENKIFVLSCIGAMIFFGLLIASLFIEELLCIKKVASVGLLICIILEHMFKPIFQRKD